jgi:hypothetical protein
MAPGEQGRAGPETGLSEMHLRVSLELSPSTENPEGIDFRVFYACDRPIGLDPGTYSAAAGCGNYSESRRGRVGRR